jgi:threonine dehydrogenase-like Zn-dependent dehydrogenase
VPPREVALLVQAVGMCGTDLHIYRSHGNYNFDAQGRPIPFAQQPQILGHEFTGEIVEVARVLSEPLNSQNPTGRLHSESLRRMLWVGPRLKTEIPV